VGFTEGDAEPGRNRLMLYFVGDGDEELGERRDSCFTSWGTEMKSWVFFSVLE
jgi:hypothetical protein